MMAMVQNGEEILPNDLTPEQSCDNRHLRPERNLVTFGKNEGFKTLPAAAI